MRNFAPISRPSCRRWLSLVAALALVLCAGALAAEEPRTFDLRIASRAVVGNEETIRVLDDDQVELRWTTDERVELHLHGYNISLDVRPGETATMSFKAFATGHYPITSHGFGNGKRSHSKGALIYLEVYPR